MNMKLIPLIMTLVVGIILAGSVLMPVLNDAQKDLGNETTLENTAPAGAKYDYSIWDGSDIEFTYVASAGADVAGVYSVNGVEVPLVSSEQRIIIASNEFATRSGGTAVGVLNSQHVDSTTQYNNIDFTFSVVNKEYTLTIGEDTLTGPVDWLVFATNNGTAGLIQCANVNNPFYTSDADKIIVLGNIYTTGENDTFYSYYDGDLTVNETYADESSVTLTKTLADGYTDIYNTTIAVNIGDETFTPFFILVPQTVAGHEASGATYSLLGAIPIMVIVALLMLAVGAIVRRND